MNKNPKQRNLALQFVLLMGLVSLFADIIYEGARAVIGPYLAILGANAIVIGLIAGVGEFFGYCLRVLFGYLADRSRAYWGWTVSGYCLILSIPLLALTKKWEVAVIFIILERLGKAMRSPARDTLLSYTTKELGRGLGFGIHEAMDQIGAVIGPLLFGIVFLLKGTYQQGFALLLIPGVLMLVSLIVAKKTDLKFQTEQAELKKEKEKLKRIFWFYISFIFLAVLGFANFTLISYHFKIKRIFPDLQIPLLYGLAMLVDAVVAPIVGKLYDKRGMKVIISIPLVTILIPFFTFLPDRVLLPITGVILWGMVMAIHETVMRVGIADLSSVSNRGFAYGIFNTIYGLGFFLGSAIMGSLYSVSITGLILFCVFMTISCLPIYFLLIKQLKNNL